MRTVGCLGNPIWSPHIATIALCFGREDVYCNIMSLLKHSSLGPQQSEAERLYFAYGSNIHLQQMAARCHDSRLFAKGIARSYKWQINSRGGANVIKGSLEDFAEGIAFTLSLSDVQALRHHKGVKRQLHAAREFDIEFERILDTALESQNTADAARILALYNLKFRPTELGKLAIVQHIPKHTNLFGFFILSPLDIVVLFSNFPCTYVTIILLMST